MSTAGNTATAAVNVLFSGSPFPFTSLPIETQRAILSHCPQSDLLCLAIVSKHFHNLVSAILYRDFHIVFPNDDEISFESPVDGLASGLDTFTTSDYDYARHLRHLSMDTLSPGIKGERSYRNYLCSSTCGRFFNTLLYLTLKKAHFLETFRWNVRIELSRPVYRQLRQLKSLIKVHIRMQAGPPYFGCPPPLPISFHHNSPPTPVHNHTHWVNYLQPNPFSLNPPSTMPIHHPQDQLHTKSRVNFDNSSLKQPLEAARLSGFSSLKSFSVLDIGDYSLTSEMADSIKRSYNTLTELQVSLSRTFATLARKASHESDAGDSTDEEYLTSLNAAHSQFGVIEPVRAYRAQEEWDKQECLLAKILGVEHNLKKKAQIKSETSNDRHRELASSEPTIPEPGQEFISSLRDVSSKLLGQLNGSREFSVSQQEILDTIEQAARKYVNSGEIQAAKLGAETEKLADEKADADMQSEASNLDARDSSVNMEKSNFVATMDSRSNALHPNRRKLETPDVDLSTKHAETVAGPAFESENLRSSYASCQHASSPEPSWSRLSPHSSVHGVAKYSDESDTLPRATSEGHKQRHEATPMEDYNRNTRGFSLEVLKIELLPVKASVLHRALNLSALRELTLLNVGNQAPIWTALAKENAMQPLRIRSVFTDNASRAFLNFASNLEVLDELFMLERRIDHVPASFAPRAAITIDQIRRLVLKKHMPHLKRLMIKDESIEANWDINEKTMILICHRGEQLEELAVSMNTYAVHALMQYFSGLVNLRAINILRLKSNDTCIWVVGETLRFIVDNLSHHEDMKLEWIAMENDGVARVVRRRIDDAEDDDEPRRKQTKKPGQNLSGQQQSSSAADGLGGTSSGLPIFASDAIPGESDSEDERFDTGAGLRYTTVGLVPFYDVWGIRIFEKDIRSGRL